MNDQKPIILDVPRFEQPDDVTCGPTCLTQIYRYYGCQRTVSEVIQETPRNPDGGTLAVYLGTSALRNGFRATIYSLPVDPRQTIVLMPDHYVSLPAFQRFVTVIKEAFAAIPRLVPRPVPRFALDRLAAGTGVGPAGKTAAAR